MARPSTMLKTVEGDQDHAGTDHGECLESSVHSTGPVRQDGWLWLAARLALRAAINPRLAIDLCSLAWAFRARAWYRSPPFLPLPPSDYIRWRMYTAYGDTEARPSIRDVIRFARWRRELMRL